LPAETQERRKSHGGNVWAVSYLNFCIAAAASGGGRGALLATSGLAQTFTMGRSRLDTKSAPVGSSTSWRYPAA